MTNRIPSLDGFRALSILLVLLAHVARTADVPAWLAAPVTGYLDPVLGVRVFFVISGFLITSLLLKEEAKQGAISINHFYVRRSLRILPVYWSYVLVVLVLDKALNFGIPPGAYWHAVTFTTGFTETGSWALGHTWSLSVEEFFYLVWPITFFYSPPRRRMWIALATVVLMPLVRVALYKGERWHLLELTFLGHWDSIMWGCLLALIRVRHETIWKRVFEFNPLPFRVLAFATAVLLMELALHRQAAMLTVPLGVTLQSLGIAYLIGSYVHLRGGPVFAFLNLPAVAYLGVLSYSLYIWQQIFLQPVKAGMALQPWQHFPLNIVLVFAAAAFSYYCIERPFLRLKGKFTD